MQRTDPKYPEFKEEFWEWFRSLTITEEGNLLEIQRRDMAETNFYFTVWSKNKINNQ